MFALVLVSRNLCAIKSTFVVILSTLHGTWHRVRISNFLSNHYMILVTRQSTLVFPIFDDMRQFSGNIRKGTSEIPKRTSVSREKNVCFFYISVSQPFLVKFIYSEKATKICEISTLLLTGTIFDKSKVEISQNFVAFSEYMNFITISNYFSLFWDSNLSHLSFGLFFLLQINCIKF